MTLNSSVLKNIFSVSYLSKILLLIIIPIFLSFNIIFLGTFAGYLWVPIFIALFFTIFVINANRNFSGEIFVIIFLLYFIFWPIKKITNLPITNLWQLFLVFSIFGFPSFLKQLREAPYLRYGVIFFLFFLVVGMLSTALVNAKFWPVTYQFISDLKPILLIVSGFAIVWGPKVDKVFWQVVNWFWLPMIILIAIEWVAPSAYFTIFEGAPSADPTGLFPSRAVGIFQHPSFLASSAAMFAMLVFTRSLLEKEHRLHNWVRIIVYLIIIFCSVQRQELIAVLLAVLLIFILAKPDQVMRRGAVSVSIFAMAAAILWMFFSENILNELVQWGVGTMRGLEHPRAQIYEGAFYLASEYFPLGSGLGTYGGAGADKFDQSLYLQLGFSRYWWFGKESFLMDTYWPNSIAETGVFGAGLLFVSYFLFFIHAVIKSITKKLTDLSRMYWRFCSAGVLYLLTLSFSSPAFQDPMLSFLPLLAFGIATYHEKLTA